MTIASSTVVAFACTGGFGPTDETGPQEAGSPASDTSVPGVDGAFVDASAVVDATAIVDASVVDGEAGACPSAHGPPGVFIPAPGGGYCIDATEVTKAQYQEFLDDVVLDGGWKNAQPTVCAWNTDLSPGCTTANPNLPIVCVDWCDAVAYGAWAGKRLCGRIGGGGGLLRDIKGADPSVDQWYRACSANGTRDYPTGTGADAGGLCNLDSGAAHPAGAGTCDGPYPGLKDMSGNVNEWEDACDDAGDAWLQLSWRKLPKPKRRGLHRYLVRRQAQRELSRSRLPLLLVALNGADPQSHADVVQVRLGGDLDAVPEPAFFDEAERTVERDRTKVRRAHVELDLLDPFACTCPIDERAHEQLAHAVALMTFVNGQRETDDVCRDRELVRS
jgi:hypothetical protein